MSAPTSREEKRKGCRYPSVKWGGDSNESERTDELFDRVESIDGGFRIPYQIPHVGSRIGCRGQ